MWISIFLYVTPPTVALPHVFSIIPPLCMKYKVKDGFCISEYLND